MHKKLSVFPAAAATLAAAFAPALAASAQTGGTVTLEVAAKDVAGPKSAPAEAVDDGALRYYAQQGQTGRVAAELRRLQALNPGYRQPEDLYSPATDQGGPEDQPLWDLFGANKLEELKAAIAARMADDPGWQPPGDLRAKIRHKEARARAIALGTDQDWKKLMRLAKEDPDLTDAGDVELMWTLAEGYARSKQTTEAVAIYTNLLANNSKPEERLATLQKSMSALRMVEVETLYEMGRKGADGVNEFDVIKIDLTRARISAFLHDERKDNVAAGDVQKFADFAKTADDPNQPGLVAWYRYKRQEFAEALDWFKFALEKGGDAKIAHGLAHSLRQLRKFREAEEVSYAWREYDISNSLLFVDLLEMDLTKEIPPYVEDARLDRYGKVSAEQASGEGAQALAWYAYNSCQYHTALEWFKRANAWLPKEATAYGLALTYRRLGDRKNFVETVNRYDGLFPKVVALIFPDDRYLPPTPCEETAPAPKLPPELSVLTGNGAVMGKNPVAGKTEAPASAAGGIGPRQAATEILTAEGSETALPNPMTDPVVAYPPGMAPDYPGSIHDPLRRYSWGRVPSPEGQPFRVVEPNYCGDPWQPATFNPNEFPLMADPQNPLRFLATGLPAANPAPAAGVAPAAVSMDGREPFPAAWPLLARKVPGVLPMPYEHNGFTLQYAAGPDPLHPGLLVQTLRFVAPQQIAGFWTRPWVPEPVRLVKGKIVPNVQSTLPAGCAGRAQARFQPWQQPRTFDGTQPPVQPAAFGAPQWPQAAPVYWRQPAGNDITGSIDSPAAAAAQDRLRPPAAAGTDVAQMRPQTSYAPAYPGAQPQPGPLNLPAGYNPIVIPVQPAPQYAPYPQQAQPNQAQPSPYYQQQPAAYQPQPAAAYPAPQTYRAPDSAFAPPPARPVRPVRARVAPQRHRVLAAAPVRAPRAGGGCGGGRSAQASVNLGWCLMQLERPQEAALAFDRAIATGEGKVREDAAYGKSLAALRGNLTNTAVQAANAAVLSPKRRNEIGVAVLAQRAVGSYNNGGYEEALSALDQRRSFSPETRDLTMMRAWSYYHLGRRDEAQRLFAALDRQTSTKETRQGLGALDSTKPGTKE